MLAGSLRARARIGVALAVSAGLLAACGSGTSQDEEAIREAFASYRTTLLEQNGERAADLLTSDSFAYYDELRGLAVEGSRQTIQSRRLVDQLTILILRLQLEPDRLADMDGRETVVFAVEEGLIGEEGTAASDLGRIHVDGDVATAEAITEVGTAPRVNWTFRREEGRWRIDIRFLLEMANAAFVQAAEESGLGEEDFILALLEESLGQPPPDEVWEPPGG